MSAFHRQAAAALGSPVLASVGLGVCPCICPSVCLFVSLSVLLCLWVSFRVPRANVSHRQVAAAFVTVLIQHINWLLKRAKSLEAFVNPALLLASCLDLHVTWCTLYVVMCETCRILFERSVGMRHAACDTVVVGVCRCVMCCVLLAHARL